MADISFAAQAKSNQLNAVDIMGCEPVITINHVDVRQGDQPVAIFFDGCNNRPWLPSKGMIRILMSGWGTESDNWIGKSAKIFMNPKVIYAGKEVGGIQIKAMSDIKSSGMTCSLTISRQKREIFFVECLNMQRPEYPQEKFETGIEAMANALQDGSMTLQQVIAQCQRTGDLTEQQLATLQQYAPANTDEN